MAKKKPKWPAPCFLPAAGEYYFNHDEAKPVQITRCWQVELSETGDRLQFLFLIEDENDETWWVSEVVAGDDEVTHPCRWWK